MSEVKQETTLETAKKSLAENNSIAFINDRIKVKDISEAFPTEGWENETTVNTFEFLEVLKDILTKREYDYFVTKGKMKNIISEESKSRNVVIQYQDIENYQYLLGGNVLIKGNQVNEVNALLADITRSMLTGSSYYISTAPEDYEENFMDYDVTYTIGDLVMRNEVTTSTEEVNEVEDVEMSVWVVLPVKIAYKKHKKSKE